MTPRPRILCFLDFYLPGYKAGGPPRTIANLTDNLGDDFDFMLVTRDRDVGMTTPYPNVRIDDWNVVGKAKVFYASPSTLRFNGLRKLIARTPHDAVYLNSFLSPKMTGLPLLIRRLGLSQGKPTIIAPRGEFSPNALALKPVKKSIYLRLTRLIGLYRDLYWQASSEREAQDVRRIQGNAAKNILVAPNLLPLRHGDAALGTTRSPGPLRIVFLSRISPMKNLDFLLGVLSRSKRDLRLALYGVRDNPAYWAACQQQIQELPTNISVEYVGEVTPSEVPTAFAQHDLFAFPTRGENFGHVIFESLAAGTSVLLSDQTPWRSDPGGAIEVVPLSEPDKWLAAIERWADLDEASLAGTRGAALRFTQEYLASSPARASNAELFRTAVAGRNVSR